MFGNKFLDIPIVQVSIDASLDPEQNWALGQAVAKLRFAARPHIVQKALIDLR